jgi:hypothetical protein
MNSSKLKLTFVEIVEAMCRRPRMYTLNGTFGEVLALLDGYAYGAKLGNKSRSSSYFLPYARWLHVRMNLPKDAHIWESFINSYPDESTAIIEFARLYREFEEPSGNAESTST